MADLRIAVAGAGGHMGRANIRAISARPGTVLVAAFDRPGSTAIGTDAGILAGVQQLGVEVTEDAEAALAQADVVIDFTAPAASVALAKAVAARRLVHVIGTTGFSQTDEADLRAAAENGCR